MYKQVLEEEDPSVGEEGYRRRGILLGGYKGAGGRERQTLCFQDIRYDHVRASSRGVPKRATDSRARDVVCPDAGLLD